MSDWLKKLEIEEKKDEYPSFYVISKIFLKDKQKEENLILLKKIKNEFDIIFQEIKLDLKLKRKKI